MTVRNIVLFKVLVLASFGLNSQQLVLEWNGTESDILQFVEGGKLRFSIEGHTASTPDRITFKIRSGNSSVPALTLFEGGTVRIENVDTTNTGTSTIVRKPDGTLAIRRYKIGDMAHGGIVFFIDETGEHGLVTASSDQSLGINWSSNSTTTTGASSDGIAAGSMNTLLIVSENRTGSSAAKLCNDLQLNGYGDWYLPSKEELILMVQNLAKNGLGNFDNSGGDGGLYWSSTEANNMQAITVQFFDDPMFFSTAGDTYLDHKSFTTKNVRAIRKF